MSALVHQPRLLRLIARTVRDLPWLGRSQRIVASRADVVASFERPLAFSSIAHQPNLVAGEFVIGMESGERHTAERLLLARQFPRSEAFERSATQEARARVESLLAGSERTFDLIDDYMVPVAWQAISGAFAGALPTLPPGDPMFLKLRYLGAHLIVGPVATEAVPARAWESACCTSASTVTSLMT